MELELSKLLSMYGLDLSKNIKVVRHKDDKRGYNLKLLYQLGQLNIYQSYQEEDVFNNCDYIISCLGIEYNKAQLVGVYQVRSKKKSNEVPLPKDFFYADTFKLKNKYYYELIEVPEFIDLKDRVIIQWSGGAINWQQWLHKNKKEIIQILPKGYVKNFPGYLNFVITYSQLKKIINYPEAHQDWHQMLSNVAGVYLIVDHKTGLQYIGSAYGKEGILGRWKKYAQLADGGNKKLKLLLEEDANYANHFRFTILETLPSTMNKNEVLDREKLYKLKLGSRAHGLNLN